MGFDFWQWFLAVILNWRFWALFLAFNLLIGFWGEVARQWLNGWGNERVDDERRGHDRLERTWRREQQRRSDELERFDRWQRSVKRVD